MSVDLSSVDTSIKYNRVRKLLKFIFGRPASGKTYQILEKIKRQTKTGRQCVLIVPEQFSFESERAVLRALGDKAALGVTVTSFTRLCDEVGRYAGGIAGVIEGLFEYFHARQVHDTEVVGLSPVEAAAARDQDLLLVQQVKGELLVIGNVELLHIHLGEDVERRARLNHRDAVNLVECLIHKVALLVDTTARADIVVNRLMAAERRLDDRLSRHVGAQTHVGEHVDAHDEVAHAALVARKHHPANTIARDHVRLGQTAKGDAGQIGSERGNRDVLVAVHAQAVVDLISKDHQLMPACNLDDALEHLAWIDGTRGVVGVDDDEGFGRARDLGLHILQVGIPIRLLIAQIVHGMTAGKGCARRPERIVGAGDQNLVAIVEQRVHRKLNELGHAVARVDMLHLNVGQAPAVRELLGRGSLLGFQLIPEGAYNFGYVNNGMMTMPAMALILVGCVIWVHRAYIYKEEK